MTTRRSFLRNSLAGTAAIAAGTPALGQAQTSNYKALVCVLLHGGMDSHDSLLPTDASGYDEWAKHRSTILSRMETTSRERGNLLRLSNHGQSFGFVPELNGLSRLYEEGTLAVVPNVGPLEAPTTRREMIDETATLPHKLFSHNDQRAIWVSNAPDGYATTGWGGRMLDAFGQDSDLAGISFVPGFAMCAGEKSPGVVIRPGKVDVPLGMDSTSYAGSRRVAELLKEHYRSSGSASKSMLVREMSRAQARAAEASVQLSEALGSASVSESFVIRGNFLSEQLGTVADLISARNMVGVDRQVFFVWQPGYDHHADQFEGMPNLQRAASEALLGFQRALEGMGVQNDVTTFTVSEFGRTLVANSTGTDHGWGGHHYVMGGAVAGRRVAGEIPPYTIDHDHDAGRGAMIPTTSVEQYAAPLGRWFGLSDTQLANVFPNYARFDPNKVSLF